MYTQQGYYVTSSTMLSNTEKILTHFISYTTM